nr:MAG TPA: hypothetical protein [Caudoviricetes sp.]
MESFLDRIIKEKDDLQDKIIKLDRFFTTDTFENLSPVEKMHLKDQMRYMSAYLSTLRQRINFYESKEGKDGND